jgi:hypothetical protein
MVLKCRTNNSITNKSFENVIMFKYPGRTVRYQNCIHRDKNILNMGKACYHSGQHISFFHLFSKLKIKIYKTIILPIALYGCKIVSHIKEEHIFMVSENRVMGIFGHDRGSKRSFMFHVEVFWVVTPCSVVGYQHFRTWKTSP